MLEEPSSGSMRTTYRWASSFPYDDTLRDLLGANRGDGARLGQNVDEDVRALLVEDLDDLALHVDVAGRSEYVRNCSGLDLLLDKLRAFGDSRYYVGEALVRWVVAPCGVDVFGKCWA